MDYERSVVDSLPLVDTVVRYIARRHRLSPEELDELAAAIRLKLVENDYDVMRRFQGRSSLRTYLTAVVHRHYLDLRIASWGKWRPCVQARRLGPMAVLLDKLITRDGLSFDSAAQTIESKYGAAVSQKELEQYHEQFPKRAHRRMVGEGELETVAAPGGDENDLIGFIESGPTRRRVREALGSALRRLNTEDRLILKLRFCDDVRIASIARMLSMPQKALYRRVEAVLAVLREEMVARGVGHEEAALILRSKDAAFNNPLIRLAEYPPAGPSVP